jgi:penicillin-binding protein 1A
MDFSRKGVARKQKELVSKLPRNKRKISVSLFKLLLVLFLVVIIVCLGAGFGMLKGILDDTPEVNAKDLIPTGYQTTLYDQNGKTVQVLASFDANREYVYYDDIPEYLVNAVVAIEDERFWEHNGIDVQGIGRAFVHGVKNIMSGGSADEGASTITQQLIKNQIFNVGLDEKTMLDKVERKFQEQYLALEIEKSLSKEEIIEYYLNTIYLGQGRYGVDTAAEYYFNKSLKNLTVSECAVLAAIPQNPSKYDPIVFPEKNAKRRLLVLDKMLELGFITQSEYDTAIADDVYEEIKNVSANRTNDTDSVYSYYVDEVINQLEDDFVAMGYTKSEADTLIFSGGLDVRICQDSEIQEICDEVLNDEENYPEDKYQLSYALTLVDSDGTEHNYSQNMMTTWFQEEKGESSFNLIFSSEDNARAAADEYKAAMIEETGYTELLESFKLVVQPQISFTLMDQETGQVKAIVGGRGGKTEDRSFNRASEATRQPGSTFKVLAAFLPALDGCGMGLGTTYVDEPYTYSNGTPVKNWYGESYRGAQTIRQAIQSSLNIIAVKTITDVTPELAYEYLLKMGFTTLVEKRTNSSGGIESDINQSLALGGLTDGITNLEITAAYASIANEGNYIKPVFYTEVYDHDGNLLIDNRKPEETTVCTEQTAWLLTTAMHDVVTIGTGTAANLSTGLYTAGKTGTTSSNFDAWFCGFTPYYTASIWIGYDQNTNFSAGNYHKNMWRKIMDAIVEAKGLDTSATFEMPDGITQVTICKETGLLPIEGCETTTDYFATVNVPTKKCEGNKKITICLDSHKIATNTCPNTQDYYYTIDEENDNKVTLIGADFEYTNDILKEKCPLHPEEEETEDTEETTKDKKDKTTTEDPNIVYYKVTSIINGYGGSISPGTKVEQGKSATFYITPDKGYEIADVSVDGVSVGVVSQYKFSNVKSDHTICVTFKEEATQAPTTQAPTTQAPTTEKPTEAPTQAPTEAPTEAPPSSDTENGSSE